MQDTPADTPITSLPIATSDGAVSELLLVSSSRQPSALMYWLPAMGVAAKHYLPFAQSLASRGMAVALHEWRGIGSSNKRAGRSQDWGYRELLRRDLPAGLAVARGSCPGVPTLLGGHSLGGQLACLYAGLHPGEFDGLALVASGSPYWRSFRHSMVVGGFYALAPWLARCMGHFPGRRLGFGGNEAKGVIADWALSGRTGRYAAAGMPEDLEAALARVDLPLTAVRLRDDWLGPASSLDWLLAKMPHARQMRIVLGPNELQGAADHFSWMKAPEAVAGQVVNALADVCLPDNRRAVS